MDPRHRDRVAFVRVCSGRFTKDMVVSNSRVGTADPGVARLPLLRPRSRDDQRGVRRRHHRPRQPRTVHDRRHAPHRRAGAVSRRAALSGGALRARPPAGHALQAVRRWAPAARGRRADAGVLRHERPPRADRRRRRRAAVRRDHEPPADRVRRGGADRAGVVHRGAMAGRSRAGAALARRRQTAVAVDRQDRRVLLFASEWERAVLRAPAPRTSALLAESPVCCYCYWSATRSSAKTRRP